MRVLVGWLVPLCVVRSLAWLVGLVFSLAAYRPPGCLQTRPMPTRPPAARPTGRGPPAPRAPKVMAQGPKGFPDEVGDPQECLCIYMFCVSVYPLFSLHQGVRLQSHSLCSVARLIPPHTPCSQGCDLIEVVGLPFPSCAPRGERTFICVNHVSSRHAVQKSNST